MGQASSSDGRTGVTVARFDSATPTVVQLLGGATATFDTGSLALDATFGRRWAVFFAGGSVFGLDAARGVRATILADGGGHRVFQNPNRVVPLTGATLFDLPSAAADLPDYAELGARASAAADRAPVRMGRLGAGSGARVGKYLGREASAPGGVGSSSQRLRGAGTVGVLAVVNAIGAIREPASGRWVSGARGRGGRLVPPRPGRVGRSPRRPVADGTTLVLVATDLELDRAALSRVATLASTGISRAVIPAFTSMDGDVVFAVSTGLAPTRVAPRYPGELADRLGFVAAELVARAIVRAVEPPDAG